MTEDKVEISVFRILGADPEYGYRGVDLHAGLKWGLTRSGFHDPERFEDGGVAWTDGHGKLLVPIHGNPPAAVSISVPASAIPDADLTIVVNGTELFRGPIPADGLRTVLSLDGVPVESKMEIELISESMLQTRTEPIDGSLYRRETIERSVGVAVESLKLFGDRSVNHLPTGHPTGEAGLLADVRGLPDRLRQ